MHVTVKNRLKFNFKLKKKTHTNHKMQNSYIFNNLKT